MRIVGEKFGKLRVLRELRDDVYLCRCECGNELEAFRSQLVGKIIRTCSGCGSPHRITGHQRRLKSGRMLASREYNSWSSMKYRCLNPRGKCYADYGGRGITICERWLITKPRGQGFLNFLADLGPRPLGMTLDRKDVNGNYCPENCRWADKETQRINRRDMAQDNISMDPDGVELGMVV